jgi:hypothetical protein
MDAYTELRAAGAGNLTGDATLTDFDLAPMVKPMYLHVNVPAVSTSDTLAVTCDFENSSNTTLQQTTIPAISVAGHYVCPIFCDHPDLSDLSVILDVTQNDTAAANFGAVEVWISNSRIS